MNMYLFVYGTLKKGGRNHGLLMDARHVCTTRTSDRYCLLDLSSFPGAMKTPAYSQIKGEVYEIDETILGRVDQLEGKWFFRQEVPLECNMPALIFFLNEKIISIADNYRVMSGGIWPEKSDQQ
ncbi:MAG: gamma-glutamylcyclotransferase family protein [Euryarchaeota archaeon]|nr:gamma-glutamylcyclotransferase family protein [Euryarchaeota archaeon]